MTFTVEAEELAGAWNRHVPRVRTFIRRNPIVGAALLLGAVLRGGMSLGNAIGFAVAGFLFLIASPFVIMRQDAQAIRRSPTLGRPEIVAVDDTGIRVTSALADRWLAWALIDRVASDERGVAVVLDGGTRLQWIPGRAFGGPEAQRAWVQHVEQRTGRTAVT